jgi:hypothetical protein
MEREMTDKELLLHQLKNPPVMSMALNKDHLYRMMAEHMKEAADRIEALEQHVADLLVDLPCGCGYDNPTDVCMKHLPLVRKLTEQLEAARGDAKEAEAYADELAEDQVDLCRQLIAAEDKLAKAVEALRYYAGRTTYRLCDDCPVQVHSSADLSGPARTTLADIEGEKG